jgi:hypothetical protein
MPLPRRLVEQLILDDAELAAAIIDQDPEVTEYKPDHVQRSIAIDITEQHRWVVLISDTAAVTKIAGAVVQSDPGGCFFRAGNQRIQRPVAVAVAKFYAFTNAVAQALVAITKKIESDCC